MDMSIQLSSKHGLSPLARGTLATQTIHQCLPRFIPAGAGNTYTGEAPPGILPVYPRWRGEHITELPYYRTFIGLSPLARGTHGEISDLERWTRFIPAGAGNTIQSCSACL